MVVCVCVELCALCACVRVCVFVFVFVCLNLFMCDRSFDAEDNEPNSKLSVRTRRNSLQASVSDDTLRLVRRAQLQQGEAASARAAGPEIMADHLRFVLVASRKMLFPLTALFASPNHQVRSSWFGICSLLPASCRDQGHAFMINGP